MHLRPPSPLSHSLGHQENSKDPVHRAREESGRQEAAPWHSEREESEKNRGEIFALSPSMPAATKLISLSGASLLLLVVILLLHGREGVSMGLGMKAMEMEMDSEAHGRLLWEATGRRYISYDALRGDVVPCSRPGVPYYNCRITTTANPYTRGCESIARCREAADP